MSELEACRKVKSLNLGASEEEDAGTAEARGVKVADGTAQLDNAQIVRKVSFAISVPVTARYISIRHTSYPKLHLPQSQLRAAVAFNNVREHNLERVFFSSMKAPSLTRIYPLSHEIRF
jgi:hypothetical protein